MYIAEAVENDIKTKFRKEIQFKWVAVISRKMTEVLKKSYAHQNRCYGDVRAFPGDIKTSDTKENVDVIFITLNKCFC